MSSSSHHTRCLELGPSQVILNHVVIHITLFALFLYIMFMSTISLLTAYYILQWQLWPWSAYKVVLMDRKARNNSSCRPTFQVKTKLKRNSVLTIELAYSTCISGIGHILWHLDTPASLQAASIIGILPFRLSIISFTKSFSLSMQLCCHTCCVYIMQCD